MNALPTQFPRLPYLRQLSLPAVEDGYVTIAAAYLRQHTNHIVALSALQRLRMVSCNIDDDAAWA